MVSFSLLFIIVNLLFEFSRAADSIFQPGFISDIDGTSLVSNDGTFELGFFSPGTSSNRFLGIWYKKIPIRTVVWVANRSNPIIDSSGQLTISSTGIVVLLSKKATEIWSVKGTIKPQIPILQLLNTGNLVLRDGSDENQENFLWESFDFPCDTLLSGMKLGWNLKTGLNRRLTSWKTSDDPSPQNFYWEIQLHNYPEAAVFVNNKKSFRSGPWNGHGISGAPELRSNPVFNYHFVYNEDEVYYTYELINKSVVSRVILNYTNYRVERYTWNEATKSWKLYTTVPRDSCDSYSLCGSFGKCVIGDSPFCQCLNGFKPKSPVDWNSTNWSQGCIRNTPLDCRGGDENGFLKLTGLKLPETTRTWLDKKMNLQECRAKCLANCSCMAYTNTDIRGEGSGCVMWFDNLVDIRQSPDGGQDLFVRMPASELEGAKDDGNLRVVAVIVVPIVAGMILLLVGYFIFKKRANLKEETRENRIVESQTEHLELQKFPLPAIISATDDFSINNKLGEGGFGPVYRGTLNNGQEIAVKRLSSSSGQGLDEFLNEVILIAKLQHINLVKLLGCCIKGEEKVLIYEYMPNKSLDFFIFDQTRSWILDWSKRFNIICGTARGIVYLHQDSRLRIVHRDLKASNVLLDSEMNPKISDFGVARIFGRDQTVENTKRVIGTYGYMAPEYAIYGLFSTKSDVFSFGVLLLEIVSGKKNRDFFHPDHSHGLLGHAWLLWKEGRQLELIDPCILDSSAEPEVTRCIHVGLLCVQHRSDDRPIMSSVVTMLVSETALPEPQKPGFFMENDEVGADSSSCKFHSPASSTVGLTITVLDPR